MAVNKVVFGSNTIIDISDTTAVASDVAQGKYFYTKAGVRTEGTASGGGAAIITDTTDVGGGTIRTITTTDEYYIQQSKTVTPTDQVQVVTPDTGYDALASVTVNAGGGDVDMPIFTFVWDDNWETEISATCNKTYSECSALLDQGVLSALEVDKNESGTEEYTNSLQLMSSGSEFVYSSFNGTTPYLDVHYSRNGTVSAVLPSEFTETLNITQNGTYYKDFNAITEVSVHVPSGGGGGSIDDDVVFIDYDGTVLHSYSASDFQALTAMPSNPTHTGLTAQGWNWTLSDAKAQVTAMGRCIIGQMYVTDDDKTRLYCHFSEGRLHPYLGICPNGTVTVDWGDGSATETLTGTSLTTVQTADHEYAAEGDYVITLSMASGTFAFTGTTNTTYLLRKDTSSSANIHRVYNIALYKIELGSSARIGDYAFIYCGNLESITMHDALTFGSSTTYQFSRCSKLRAIVIPSSVALITNYLFYYCYSLSLVSMPKSVTSIGTYAFYYCTALDHIVLSAFVTGISSYAFSYSNIFTITIPSGVTSINNQTFNNCHSLTSVSLPNTITSIGNSLFSGTQLNRFEFPSGYTGTSTSATFYGCSCLSKITIPDSITTIGAQTFYNCYGMVEYHFTRTTPPTLSNTNAFTNIQADCKIYVPYSADHSILNAYQTATNWSTYASYMVEEEP